MSPRLREFIKVVCVLAIAVGAVAAAIAWGDKPSTEIWSRRLIFSLICVVGLIGFLAIHFKLVFHRPDLVPDFLRDYVGTYFESDGFCFAVSMSGENRVCVLWIFYQNRFENPCFAKVGIRPVATLLAGRKLDALTFDILADCGAFGVVRAEIPMPVDYQHRIVRFELGASAEYPSAKGRVLRFGDAIQLRTNERFSNIRKSISSAALLAFGGILLLHRPASVRLKVPADVAPQPSTENRVEMETLWRIGDSGLPTSSAADVNKRLLEILNSLSRPGHIS